MNSIYIKMHNTCFCYNPIMMCFILFKIFYTFCCVSIYLFIAGIITFHTDSAIIICPKYCTSIRLTPGNSICGTITYIESFPCTIS
ncbi:hypothetical protein EUBVEN_01824 [Eubacterium ventriosum ATCC 27560]|uniref:Uncharacterized protein n=1 Tax=Eubacterium ventriosum ATCC 27560 TaxID=411463 RepID=A5Z7Y5_9FIRM|nr:hypothetical protein EUBVEN_01824 [Eubacterium ventriosum ATCC 27560]